MCLKFSTMSITPWERWNCCGQWYLLIHDINKHPGAVWQIINDYVFLNINEHYRTHKCLSERVILATKILPWNTLNLKFRKSSPGIVTLIYPSKQLYIIQYEHCDFKIIKFFLTTTSQMKKKNVAPIILLRNLYPLIFCNGTRLVAKKIIPNLIEATRLLCCSIENMYLCHEYLWSQLMYEYFSRNCS